MAAPIAVADLGTNSTRLLIARMAARGTLEELERRTTVTRLGAGVDRSGRLAEDAMARTHEALASYGALAARHGAKRRIAVATSAVRDASNGGLLRRAVRERHGFEIRTISGDEEARLTFLGATAERARNGESQGQTLVIDVGGGSTELVVGRPGAPPRFHVSTQLGSVRQTERHLTHDPPRPRELAALADEARALIEETVPHDARDGVEAAVAVAGTPTSLAAIDQALDPYDPARVHGYVVGAEAAERILHRLERLPLTERRAVAGLHPDRAPTIVAGVVILIEAMGAFGVNGVEASEADILHGAALDALGAGGYRHGEPWGDVG